MSTLLTAKNIAFELQHKTLFKALTLSVARGDRIGLVGRNGEGKTTLLKILAKELEPTSGRVDTSAKVHYLPQLDFSLFERTDTVAEFLASQRVPWSFIEPSLRRLFPTTNITSGREVRTLSGGELAKLLIAVSDTEKPDLLFLDEPTNHLDIEGIEVLKRYLLEFKGAFVVVSHDSLFLNHVTTSLWEIANGKLTSYGGNYSQYQEQKRLAEEARERDFAAKKKNLKKARAAVERRETRTARAVRAGKRSKTQQSRDKFAEGYFKGRSEKGLGRLKRRQDRTIEELQRRVSEVGKPKRKKAQLNLLTSDERSKRMLVDVSGGVLKVAGSELLRDINLRIEFGDRLVFTGKNGSGKSSLAKALVGSAEALSLQGAVRRSEHLEGVYMEQKYQSVNPRLSLIDNILDANPHLSESDARGQLGKFLFDADIDAKKKAETLSGGETARLALALVTSRPIDLLILDEPTNNLDSETLDIIADALENFPGALIVISHNIHFLAQLKVLNAYVLSGHRLKRMAHVPKDEEGFYSELVDVE